MKKIKVALVGAGNIARVSHIPAYRKMEDVEIVAVCDARLEAAQRLAQEFDIPRAYAEHGTMLAECQPDVVSVCVPNKFHHGITLDALNAGAHVLCEKPPAMTVAEAQEMADAAKTNERLLTYGFHMRYGEEVRLLKAKIDRGELGRIYAAEARWLRRRGVPGWGVFTNKAVQGGGPLIDIGAHMLDAVAYLMDYPQVDYVCADQFDAIIKQGHSGLFGAWNPEACTVEDAVFGQIHFKDGRMLRLDASFALNIRDKDVKEIKLYGDKMGASVFPLELYASSDEECGNQTYPFLKDEDLHEREMFAFMDAVRGRAPLLVTAEQGVYVQRLISLLYESAEAQRPVFA